MAGLDRAVPAALRLFLQLESQGLLPMVKPCVLLMTPWNV